MDERVIGISGTLNGAPIEGLSTFGSPSNVLSGRLGIGLNAYDLTGNGVSFTVGGAAYNVRPMNGGNRLTSDGGPNVSEDVFYSAYMPRPPVCFVTGAHIRTERGEVAVEDLQVGDQAVTVSSGLRPVIWIGQRELVEPTYEQAPVRIRVGAFGHGLPVRDLYLSPGHPVLVGADANNEGGVLVPIMCLENGTSIRREPRSSVTYWHVELDSHDIVLVEGLPAESYIDGGDRAFFMEASDHALHNPDFVPPGWGARCRPVAVDGPLVEAARLRLDAVFADTLSEHCGWNFEVVEWTAA
ncbi:hypothetical protein FHR71_001740 [Methylobacterium sp. RAS18]|nr:hypothetical protein [Methylobacterium sp. RAS18]